MESDVGLMLDAFEGFEDEFDRRRMRRLTFRGAGPGKQVGRPRGLCSFAHRLFVFELQGVDLVRLLRF